MMYRGDAACREAASAGKRLWDLSGDEWILSTEGLWSCEGEHVQWLTMSLYLFDDVGQALSFGSDPVHVYDEKYGTDMCAE